MKISELWIYPVKSCRGIRLEHADYDHDGLKFDRQWMVVDEATHLFQTARTIPRMVLIGTRLTDAHLELTIPAHGDNDETTFAVPLTIDKSTDEHIQSLRIWASPPLDGYVVGNPALTSALSSFLGKSVMLVRKGDELREPGAAGFVGSLLQEQWPDIVMNREPSTAWQDAYPLLFATQESIQDVRNRIASVSHLKGFDAERWPDRNAQNQFEMTRFRPNIVVEGAKAWEEDEWGRVDIGQNSFVVTTRCARCVLPSVDPATGKRDKVLPDSVLKQNRQDLCPQPELKGKVYFGVNALPINDAGSLRVGDEVRISRRYPQNAEGGVERPEDFMAL